MENLQTLGPFFQKLMEEWYQLTLHNQEYAICLAISVWLLTAIFYSIRIGFLNKRNNQLVSAYRALQTKLTEVETQTQAIQQQLTEAGEKLQHSEQQIETEIQRAAGIEQRLNRSNQQLASSLSSLVGCFELNLENLPNAEADNLLSEFSTVITRVSERFKNEQEAKTQLQLTMHAEAEKMAEKEAMVESLQSRLDNQTQQLAKLEMVVEKYAAAERQMELDQQQFALERQQHQSEASRLAELEKQVAAQAQIKPKENPVENFAPASVVESAVKSIGIAEAVVEKMIPESVNAVSHPPVETKAKVKNAETGKGTGKGFFGRAMEKFSKFDEKLGMQPVFDSVAEKLEERVENLPVEDVKAAVQEVVEIAKAEVQPKSSGGFNQKISGLFGGMKKTVAKTSAESAVAAESLVEATALVAQASTTNAEKSATKLTGMFDSFKRRK